MPQSIQVLHVDDEPNFGDLTATYLERENDRFVVQTATSASEGIARIEEEQPDCVVSDYDMPGQSGIEFLESVREKQPNLPFILFTGKGSEEIASDAISAGVTDYLQKETGTDQYAVLANRIQNAVERVRAKQQQERQLQAIESAQEGISILDENGHYLFVNNAFADMHGYEPDQLLGEHWELVYPDEDIPEVRQEILPAVEEAGSWHGETTSLRADGITFEVDHTLAVTDQGELVCTVRDISEEKERKQRLQQSTVRLEALFENSPDMINFHDIDGNITDANPRLCEMTGYDADTLTGMKIWELDQNIDPSEARPLWNGMEVGDRRRLEGEYRRQNGSTFPVEVHIQRLDVANKSRFVAISRDITDRRRTEKRREQIIDRMNDAVIEVDSDWQITLVNNRTEEFSGRTESELLGRDFWTIFAEARGTRFEEKYRQAMDAREKVSITDYYSGVGEWFDIQVYPNEDGGLAFYFQTVTEYKERQRELQRIERRYQAMFDDSNILAGILDPDGTVVEQNQTAMEYIDAEIDDVVGEPFWETPWWPNDLRPVIREKVEQAAEGEYTEYEADLEEPDGTTYSIEGVIRPVTDETDDIVSLIVSGRDVTQRKQQEQALEEVNQRFELLAEAVPNGLFLVNADYSELYYCNSAAEDLYGVDIEVLQDDPSTWMRHVHPDDVDQLKTDIDAQRNDYVEGTQHQKFRIQHPDKQTRWLEVEVHPVEENGEIERLAGVATDITEREQRRRTLERYERIVETMDDVAFVIDDKWSVAFTNGAISEYVDLPLEMLEDQPVMHLVEEFIPESASRERFRQALERTFQRESEEGSPERIESALDVDSGTSIFEYQFSPLVADGETTATVVTMRDITERRRREQQLERQTERFDELASAVSHDLQTPLATARGRAELAVETGDTEQMEQALQALERVDELRENLVQVLRTNQIVNETELVDIERIGRDAWKAVQTSGDVSLQIHDNLCIDADPGAVQRLLENLFSNAIEHGGADTTVRVGEIEDGFFVEDDGPGIPESERDKVFTPGYSSRGDGSGVGLASVRQIITAHGWQVEIAESTEGGARFELTGIDTVSHC